MTHGWFIDWDGYCRTTAQLCNGERVVTEGDTVEVLIEDGEVIYTTTLWTDFQALEYALNNAGCVIVWR